MVGVVLGSGLEVVLLISGVFISELCIVAEGVETGFGSLLQPNSNAKVAVRKASSMSFRFMSVSKFYESPEEE